MAQKKIIEAIRYLCDILKHSGLAVSKVILFGSQASGLATDESDIDIAIISNDFTGKTIFERALMTKDAEIETIRKFMVPFDIVTLTNEELTLESSPVAAYAQEGEVILSE